ncbi:MAG: DUF4126 family protein [Acidobacteriota bacterium]
MTLLLPFLIGFFAGLRSLTPLAATSWGAYLGWLRLERPLSLVGSLPAVCVLTLLAAAELVADKLPNTPNRTSPPGLIARIVSGGFAGACVSASLGQAIVPGAAAGAAGGVAGTFAGYRARTGLVRALGTPDIYVALLEDLIAVAGSLWVVSHSL